LCLHLIYFLCVRVHIGCMDALPWILNSALKNIFRNMLRKLVGQLQTEEAKRRARVLTYAQACSK